MYCQLAMRGSNDFPSKRGGQPRHLKTGRGPSFCVDDDEAPNDESIMGNKPTDFRNANPASLPAFNDMSRFPSAGPQQDSVRSSSSVAAMPQNAGSVGSQRTENDQSGASPFAQGNDALFQILGSPLALQGVLGGGGQLLQLPGFMGNSGQNSAMHFSPAQLQFFAQASMNQSGASLPPLGTGFPNMNMNMNTFPQQGGGESTSTQGMQASFPMEIKSANTSSNATFGSTAANHVYRENVMAPTRNDDQRIVEPPIERKSPPPFLPPAKRAKVSGSQEQDRQGGAQPRQTRTPTRPVVVQKGVDATSGRIADRRYNNPASSMSLVASARAEDRSDQKLTGIRPTLMYLSCDDESLSDYQCFLRQQIELFEATSEDLQLNAQKMNKSVVLGQVGIRCRHCAQKPPWTRARGAVYYSATLDGLYQAGQNMSKNHLSNHCTSIPDSLKQELINLKDSKRRAGGGKQYWSEAARALGVFEDQYGLRFRDLSSKRSTSSS